MKASPDRLPLAGMLICVSAAVVSISLLHAKPAHAATIYRCGPDQKLYSQLPCEGGRSIEVHDRRNADQIEQAQSAAQTHARVARDFERSRKELDRGRPSFSSLSPRSAGSGPGEALVAKSGKSKSGSKSGKKSRKHDAAHPVEGAEFTAVDQTSASKKHPAKSH